MAQEDVRLSGTFLDSAGNALADKTVTLFSEGTITPALTTDTTDSSGEWDFTRTTPGRYDVQLVTGTQTYRILGRDKFQVTELQARNATSLTQPAGIFTNTYTNGGAAAAGLTAIHSFRPATESSGVESAVAGVNGSSVYNDFQLTNSATTPEDFIAGRLAFEAVDVANGSEDSKLNLWTMTNGTLTEVLHLDGTSLHPETTDGVSLGTSALNFSDLFLDSGAVINLDGGDVTLTHSSNTLTVAGGTFATAALTTSTIVASGIVKTDDSTDATSTTDGSLQTDGGLSVVKDAVVGNDLHLLSDSAVFNMGAGSDFSITHDGTTGATLAGNPIEIDSGGNITLDAHTGIFIFQDANTEILRITESGSGDVTVKLETNAKDLIFTDNGDATGLTIKDAAAGIVVPGEVMTTKVSYTDGDDAITIADGGGTTFAQNAAFSGVVDITDTTDASDATGDTGALRTEGGASIAKKLYVGTDLDVTGNTTLNGNVTLGNHIDDVITITGSIAGANAVIFEGNSADGSETTLAVVDPTSDHTVYMPNQGGYLGVFDAASTTQITATPAEINLIDGGTARGTDAVGDGDGVLINDGGTMKMTTVQTLATYLAGVNAGTVTSTGLSDSSGVLTVDIQNMTASTTIADADLVVIDDGAGGTLRKMTRANFIESAALDAINIDGGAIDGVTLGTNSAVTQAIIDSININGTTIGHTSDTDLLTLTSANLAVAGDVALAATKKLILDGGGEETYIYEESADDLHIVVGNVAMIQIDQDIATTGSMAFGAGATPTADQAFVFNHDFGEVTVNNTNLGVVLTPRGVETGGTHGGGLIGMRIIPYLGAANTQAWNAEIGVKAIEARILDGTSTSNSYTVTGAAGLHIKQAQNKGNITLTNQYGVYFDGLTAATNDFYFGFAANDTTANTGNEYGRIPIAVNGTTLKYLRVYDD